MVRRTLPALTAAFAGVANAVVLTSVAPAPAAAATCASDAGVSVVVDFNELGGGATASCDADGGGEPAADVFPDAGYPLTYVQGDPGFVCRVSGRPADNPCVNTPPGTAYWSLWWSDGTSGTWRYSSSGVGSLTVPDGGYVAFAWHQGGGNARPPDVAPVPHEEPSEPSPKPSDDGGSDDDGDGAQEGNGRDPGSSATAGSGAATDVSSTSAAATSPSDRAEQPRSSTTDRRRDRDRRPTEPTSTASSTVPAADEITAGPPPSDVATDTSGDGGALPTWVGLGLAGVVLAAAGLVAVLRRRTG